MLIFLAGRKVSSDISQCSLPFTSLARTESCDHFSCKGTWKNKYLVFPASITLPKRMKGEHWVSYLQNLPNRSKYI